MDEGEKQGGGYQWDDDDERESEQVGEGPCRYEELGPEPADQRDLQRHRANQGNKLHVNSTDALQILPSLAFFSTMSFQCDALHDNIMTFFPSP